VKLPAGNVAKMADSLGSLGARPLAVISASCESCQLSLEAIIAPAELCKFQHWIVQCIRNSRIGQRRSDRPDHNRIVSQTVAAYNKAADQDIISGPYQAAGADVPQFFQHRLESKTDGLVLSRMQRTFQ